MKRKSAGAAVYCPICEAQFGGMARCPWDDCDLLPLEDVDATALAFYEALAEVESKDDEDS